MLKTLNLFSTKIFSAKNSLIGFKTSFDFKTNYRVPLRFQFSTFASASDPYYILGVDKGKLSFKNNI
jgi:hypothetical protein